ncbi:MAG: 30S ribosomal protein S3 [Candidatus Shikimatogenerans bostrichidophilus]|nr:MAG: 30S ribosomal protein S3 [Candidatus Shikimatogenerans bostrichidophilus]
MGQKTNPISNRLGIIHGWKSLWFNNYYLNVTEDYLIRNFINNRFLNKFCISTILIERTINKILINICTSRPAIVIGKKGSEVNFLKKKIKKIVNNNRKNFFYFKKNNNIKNLNIDIYINVIDIINPEIDSLLVAKNICRQIENRISYKRSIKLSIINSMKMNINGIKIRISGRLNGAEMARTEIYKDGFIKISTFRSNIDYGFYEANTKYGKIGVKVWIMKGEIYNKNKDLKHFYKFFFKKRKKKYIFKKKKYFFKKKNIFFNKKKYFKKKNGKKKI